MQKNQNVKKDELGISEIAASLPILPAQIRNYLKTGRLNGKKTRNKWKVTREALNQFKTEYGFN